MSKAKAPGWLRESFKDGIDERFWEPPIYVGPTQGVYPGANARCQLAYHDPLRRPCSGRLERFHWVNRQRIERAMDALLPRDTTFDENMERAGLVLLAAWDSRIGAIACEEHHRRFDNHATPPLIVPYEALPSHVIEWSDWRAN